MDEINNLTTREYRYFLTKYKEVKMSEREQINNLRNTSNVIGRGKLNNLVK